MEPIKFSKIQNKEFSDKSTEIVKAAQDEGIVLRIIGAMAVYIHVQHDPFTLKRYVGLDRLGADRPMFTDLDLMGYSKQFKEIANFFKNMGFKPDFYVNSLFGNRRNIFQDQDGLFDVDVFYNTLSFSHDVQFIEDTGRGRLELDFPTISLSDLTLEKLQIHQINRKDLVDLFILFSSHEVGEDSEQETINGRYIANILSSDWGFEYDAMANLDKVKSLVENLLSTEKIEPRESQMALKGITDLTSMINTATKSKNWKKRAKKGTSKPWFQHVDEVQR